MEAAIRRIVWERAASRCEYCHMPQSLDSLTFEVEHVIPEKHGGASDLDNLALACFFCNRFKGPNLAGIDPFTQQIVPLFHPRREAWAEHFLWSDAALEGISPQARATVVVLRINDHPRITTRAVLIASGEFSNRS